MFFFLKANKKVEEKKMNFSMKTGKSELLKRLNLLEKFGKFL